MLHAGLVLWDAAYILADLIERDRLLPPSAWTGSSCVELGAGVGLPSLVAWLKGARVIATDGAEQELGLLRENMGNAAGVDGHAPLVESTLPTPPPHVMALWWGKQADTDAVLHANGGRPFDIVLCCECVYNADGHLPLLAAWDALAAPDAVILLAYKRRGLDEDAFAELLGRHPAWRIRRISPRLFPADFVESDIIAMLVRRA